MKPLCKNITTINEFIDAIRIRVDVFIIEQKCPAGWEPDEEDKIAINFIAVIDNKIVSTARVREVSLREFKIERMATRKKYRGKGIGKELLEYILKYLQKQKPKRIWMESQVQTQGFYKKLGFVTVSKPYDLWDLGIPHVKMEYRK